MKSKYLLFSIICVCLILISTIGCSVVGIRTTEEPNYTVIKREGQIEIRKYESYFIAQTTMSGMDYRDAGNKAFRKLFKYISGENTAQEKIKMTAPVLGEPLKESEKIEMTAPVIAEKSNFGWAYAFVLPLKYKVNTIPTPKDESIEIIQVQAKTVAVYKYSGKWGREGYDLHREKLQAWLKKEGIESLSQPRSAGYDPPWTIPSLRRNEILIDVNYPSSIE